MTAARRRWWSWTHTWSSLICTIFALLLCLTGLPLIFHDELGPNPALETGTDRGVRASVDAMIAQALAERPGAQVHLVERIAKKAAFLREAIRVTGAPGIVHLSEIGDIVEKWSGGVDCVTARALAPLHQLIGFAEPLVKRGAKALFLKGQDVEAELTESTKYWKIEPKLYSSRTGGQGWIVAIDCIERHN